jgi:hypothetical protein
MKTVKAVAAVTVLVAGLIGVGYAQQRRATGTLTVDDYLEIQRLYARYSQTIDSGEDEGRAWAATFTADGVFGNAAGRAALAEFAKHRPDRWNGAQSRHWISNLVITPTAEGASGSCYLLTLNVSARPPVLNSAAVYEDTLVKTPEGWRFKKRLIHSDGAAAPR